MAVQYTYDDFMKAANNAGLLSQFSQADLQMAQSDPNFGMSILGLKQNWQNATTDAERQSINDQANALRSSYGNYTGGADGSQYISTGLLNQKIDDQMDKINSYAPFSYDTPAPTYTNQYAAQQQALLNEILNREAFSWSKEDDPSWSAYKKEYLREGDRATANALAAASAASGGRPSSYAMTAAGQAGDYYAAQLSDKIPELYQQAYERYLNDLNLKYSDLNAVNNLEQLDYNKYLNDLSQWNTDRSFAYNDYQTQYNMLQNYLADLQGQQQTEFNQGLTMQQYQDEIARQQDALKQQAVENALAAAQVFGYVPENGADALGIAAGTPTAEQAYNEWYMAQQAAQQAAKAASGSSGGDGEEKAKPTMTLAQANSAIENGLVTDAVKYAFDYYMGDGAYEQFYGSGGGLQVDVASVLALGYGPISEARLNELVQSGEVQEYEENGYLKFRKVETPASGFPALLGLR